MQLPPERRLSSITLGGMFLGLMMAWFGFLPQEGSPQPLPIWAWRTLGGTGLFLTATAIAAQWIRSEWARKAAIAGLLATNVPLALILALSLMSGRFNPFTLLLGLGIVACGKGISFYNSDEIRSLYQQQTPFPPKPPGSAGN